jgi:hypothetical protein
MSNRSLFETTEYEEWKKEVEESGEYEQWINQQLLKEQEEKS